MSDRDRPKKPKVIKRAKIYMCPNCKFAPVYPAENYCVNCGQKLGWTEDMKEEE